MLAHPHLELPVLNSVVEAPVFSPDGQLLQTQGFHPTAGIYIDLPQGFRLRRVPPTPTPSQVKSSVSSLLDLVCEFPFVSDADSANAIGFIILPTC